MIQIEKKDCCGCSACVNICPYKCIVMKEDEEGFFYPLVNEEKCIGCGKCDSVCPILNTFQSHEPIGVFAAINQNETIRLKSSSGGLFTAIADKVLEEGGIVFGAMFDEKWRVVHGYCENKEDLQKLRGSKYVQSDIGDTYALAKSFLDGNKKVLFSGTPCQIAGLKSYLGKEYPNLISVDVICHGVPSPGVFRWYLLEELQKAARQGSKNSVLPHSIHSIPERDALSSIDNVQIKSIAFRDKRLGWKKFSFALTLDKVMADGKKNTVSLSYVLYKSPFLRGFLGNLYLRPSCYQCKLKCFNSGSDFTLGDYWGIGHVHPKLEDDKGVSILLMNTPKAISMNLNNCHIFQVSIDDIKRRNGALLHSQKPTEQRAVFYMNDGKSFMEKIDFLCKSSIKTKLRRWIRGKAYQIKVRLTR